MGAVHYARTVPQELQAGARLRRVSKLPELAPTLMSPRLRNIYKDRFFLDRYDRDPSSAVDSDDKTAPVVPLSCLRFPQVRY